MNRGSLTTVDGSFRFEEWKFCSAIPYWLRYIANSPLIMEDKYTWVMLSCV